MRLPCTSFLLGLAAAGLLASRGAAGPEESCQKATASALARCVRTVADAEAACFRKSGAACGEADARRARALSRVGRRIEARCTGAAEVAAAGYAPLLPAELGARLAAACAREVGQISARLFGEDGEALAGAGDEGAQCLLAAHGRAGELLGKAIQTAGRCAGRLCDAADLDRADAALEALEQRAAAKIEGRCEDFAGLVGADAASFARETADRAETAASAPCDPLDRVETGAPPGGPGAAPGHCLFPFPNDYFSVGDLGSPTGRRLAFQREALPANQAGVHIDPARWNEADGFSVGPMLLFHDPDADLGLSGAPPITDLAASLDPASPVLLLDAETGAQQLLWVERDASHEIEAEQGLVGRVGANLENGRRYLVAVRGLVDAQGAPRPAGAVFAAYRDRAPTAQLPVEARRRRMERLFAELEAFGVARAELQLAWEFTTQSVESTASRLLAMRDDAFAILGEAAPEFTVDAVDEPGDGQTFRRIDGTFQVPLYLDDGGEPGSTLRTGPDGLPVNEGDFFTARYRCVVPDAATTAGGPPAVPARASLYGHGLLGSISETSASHVRRFADDHNFVLCGTDWSGFADEDLPTVYKVLQDFSNFPTFIDRQHQGVLNFLVLARLMIHPDGLGSHAAFQVGGESVIDPSGVYYDGNSQGGIMGGVVAAFAQDVERFVLGVPGMNYSTLLYRSTDFEPFGIVLRAGHPNGLDRLAMLALAQIVWDRTDPNGHVRHTTADTYPNTPPKKLLYHVAFGDHQVAPVTVEIAARSNGAHLRTPALAPGKVVPEVTPYFGIPPILSYPFDGSAVVIWDSGNPAPPIEGVPPPEIPPTDPLWPTLSPCAQNWDSDPHECPRRAPEARLQKSEFLREDGAVVDTCGSGMACLAPTF